VTKLDATVTTIAQYAEKINRAVRVLAVADTPETIKQSTPSGVNLIFRLEAIAARLLVKLILGESIP